MDDLDRALGLLGPLEARIMRLLWSGLVGSPFVVRDVAARLEDLAYTTVMTTVRRLAEKGPLTARAVPGKKAYEYELVLTPAQFLDVASRQEAAEVVARYGDAALAAFAARLDELSPDQRTRLEQLRGQR
ncbi:MAG TPA: BlaI/MecI/CopY family transcriptional regulator [Actinospica sp.]|jgi:predicted transcriptional regulator|nr:BlaI/MecI/CopY family transcriptional regulator [Actinospica sp.]